MENIMQVSAYIYNRYKAEFGQRIDEMKLHKLLYLAQRESFIQNDKPLFNATFYGWKYGPILKEIHGAYQNDSFAAAIPKEIIARLVPIIDKVFSDYAEKSSWSLSRLTHGEISWKNSRVGVPQAANSDNAIKTEDIRQDAIRVRERREMLNQYGLL
ncbi:MAG: DUF4065 domain-containing protein [Ruminococcaceae bacterium]|nr:DUF4065 domain-containing protein [Oscillospiraceae bacterium]